MIRTLLALDGALVLGALSFVLAAEEDIRVVAKVDRGDAVSAAVRAQRPDVMVADLDFVEGVDPDRLGLCPVLVLAHPHRARRLRGILCPTRAVGILRSDAAPSGSSKGSAGSPAGSPCSTRISSSRRCARTAH